MSANETVVIPEPLLRDWVRTLRGPGRRVNAPLIASQMEEELTRQGFPPPVKAKQAAKPA